MSEPIPLFPEPTVDPAVFAEVQHDRFRGHNMRIGLSSAVHASADRPWINGLTLLAPACHQGWSGLGSGELTPTRHEVTCLKCRRIRGLGRGDEAQYALFALPATGTG
ncbi:hypothetical protein [Amycolatopsis sp. CA-230715]|uniref:hypothetical protein n=1 Tax=Amycolatopsis sp. CA-230715 TaxID=2745196 RepID=UPI001C022288|nr:hypothetical protein [Amycolatopsis sp. CA-230715]QWF76785.1 hypothetical protein HUW46_00164 [Amycolatopsis sp. CA-230715]